MELGRKRKREGMRRKADTSQQIDLCPICLPTTSSILSTQASVRQLWQEIVVNGCIGMANVVWHVETPFLMKECGMTFLGKEERCLDGYPHDDNEIWRMALAKIEGVSPEEIKTIKDNPSESLELDWDAEPIINLLNLEQFHKHYQELAPTRKEQKQWLEQLNT
ncbi:hypothetical protein G9A89_003264 [Geosiphon pyriformis]|nr:hypothetical protein G9A89_003264 [Geosiphon pyriformis]